MALIKNINIGGQTYSVGQGNGKVFYGTCSSAANATTKVVTCSEFAASDLTDGTILCVNFTNVNTAADIDMNVNSTGAADIYVRYGEGIAVTDNTTKGLISGTCVFVYANSVWVCISAYPTGYNVTSILEELFNNTNDNIDAYTSGDPQAYENFSLPFTGTLPIGSPSVPIYINSYGVIEECDNLISGIEITNPTTTIMKVVGVADSVTSATVTSMISADADVKIIKDGANTSLKIGDESNTTSIGYLELADGHSASSAKIYFYSQDEGETPTYEIHGEGNPHYNIVVASDATGRGDSTTPVFVDSSGVIVPCNPINTDFKVQQNAVITTNNNYPILLGYDTSTSAQTNTVNKSSSLLYNPSTKKLTSGALVVGTSTAAGMAGYTTSVPSSTTGAVAGQVLFVLAD